jgi:hypothetical protein
VSWIMRPRPTDSLTSVKPDSVERDFSLAATSRRSFDLDQRMARGEGEDFSMFSRRGVTKINSKVFRAGALRGPLPRTHAPAPIGIGPELTENS